MCLNKVIEGNLIDSLKITGGFSKEIKRRALVRSIAAARKIEAQLIETTDFKTKD